MADGNWFTKPGEMIDYICWKHYGQSSGYVEAVLENPNNYRLSDQPELLPGELDIFLPDIVIENKFPIRLWDEEKLKEVIAQATGNNTT